MEITDKMLNKLTKKELVHLAGWVVRQEYLRESIINRRRFLAAHKHDALDICPICTSLLKKLEFLEFKNG